MKGNVFSSVDAGCVNFVGADVAKSDMNNG